MIAVKILLKYKPSTLTTQSNNSTHGAMMKQETMFHFILIIGHVFRRSKLSLIREVKVYNGGKRLYRMVLMWVQTQVTIIYWVNFQARNRIRVQVKVVLWENLRWVKNRLTPQTFPSDVPALKFDQEIWRTFLVNWILL